MEYWYYVAIKKWDIAICSNMDGPRENIMLSEVSHMKVKVKSLSMQVRKQQLELDLEQQTGSK